MRLDIIPHITIIVLITFSSLLLPTPISFAKQNLRQTQESKVAEVVGRALNASDHAAAAGGGIGIVSSLRAAFEQQRSTPIEQTFKGRAWHPSLATWFNATRNVIAATHDKITVYYPGAGGDILYPLLATNGDVFIFVDLGIKKLPSELIDSIRNNGGSILRIRKGIIRRSEYYVKFFIFGKTRELYYYCGVNATEEKQLPQRVKDGFNVYIERNVATGYTGPNAGEILPLSMKYLSDKGFTITDYRIWQVQTHAHLFQIGYTRYKETYSFNLCLKPHISPERILVIDTTEERAEAIKDALVSRRALPGKNIYAIGQPQPGQAVDEILRQKYGEVPNIDYVFNNSGSMQLILGSLTVKIKVEYGRIEDINKAAENITMWL